MGATVLTAIAPAVWGTTYLVTTEFLPSGHPLFAALLRSLPAGVLALVLSRTLPYGAWWWKAAVLGTLNIGAFFPLLFVAAERLPGGVAATLGATQPLLVAVLGVVILRERLSRWRATWGVVGVLGVALVVLGPDAALDPLGIAAGLASAASMGLGVILTKRWGRPDNAGPLALAGWQLTAGGLVLATPALLLEGIPAQIDVQAAAGYDLAGDHRRTLRVHDLVLGYSAASGDGHRPARVVVTPGSSRARRAGPGGRPLRTPARRLRPRSCRAARRSAGTQPAVAGSRSRRRLGPGH